MSTKNTIINNINTINKTLEKIQKNYEKDLKTYEKDILTKISKKFNISINILENCINGFDDEKQELIDIENSDDDGQLLQATKINNKTFYLDNKQNKIYKKKKGKFEHVGNIVGNEYILN